LLLWQWSSFVAGVLAGKLEEGCCDDGEILNVCSEKIAQSDERSNGFDISGWFGVFDSLQLVFSWLDTFWHKCEAQVRDFFVAEKTFI
jgi:hypothetical protein